MYKPSENQYYLEQLQSYNKAQIANRHYFKRLLWFTLLTLVIASIYLFAQRPASLSSENALLALGITWLGFLPSLLYLLNRNRPPMPFFPLVGLFYATSFGLPMFASGQKNLERFSLANVSSTALILVLLGVAGMITAFFASKYFLWRKVFPIQLPGPYSLSKFTNLLWLLLLSHIAFLYIPFIQKIPSIGQLLDPVGYLVYGMFYIIWSRGKLPYSQTWLLLFLFVPLEITQRFVSGSIAQLMLLGLFIMIVVWYERQRIPVFLISITLLFLIAFNPIKSEYRYLTWSTGKFSQTNFIEKVQLFTNLAIKKYQTSGIISQSKTYNDASALNSVINRTAHIAVFSEVIKDTPARVPYWGGKTYGSIVQTMPS